MPVTVPCDPSHPQSKAINPTDALFGADQDGHPFTMPISEGPHFIICGQTGSGKSVYINHILISMMSHTTPDELSITWVDPKKVESIPYVDNPFCPINPVIKISDAYGLMMYYTQLMEARYDDLEKINVKKIDSYNEWVHAHPEKAADMGLTPMKYMVCVIDEYADMVMQEPEVEQPIIRLGAKARAAGIHLLIATQRPSANVISPTLKANIPSRVCLKVTDSTNSQIVIDEPGGEKLSGPGDSIVKDKNGNITRCQGNFIDDDEIARIFEQQRASYPKPDFIDYKQAVVDSGECEWADDYDENTPWEKKHVKKVRKRRR